MREPSLIKNIKLKGRPTVSPNALFIVTASISSEEKRNAPYTSQSDYGVDYSADYCSTAAECPSNKVKTKKSNKTPVECADDYKN